jgi:hypothetical protein
MYVPDWRSGDRRNDWGGRQQQRRRRDGNDQDFNNGSDDEMPMNKRMRSTIVAKGGAAGATADDKQAKDKENQDNDFGGHSGANDWSRARDNRQADRPNTNYRRDQSDRSDQSARQLRSDEPKSAGGNVRNRLGERADVKLSDRRGGRDERARLDHRDVDRRERRDVAREQDQLRSGRRKFQEMPEREKRPPSNERRVTVQRVEERKVEKVRVPATTFDDDRELSSEDELKKSVSKPAKQELVSGIMESAVSSVLFSTETMTSRATSEVAKTKEISSMSSERVVTVQKSSGDGKKQSSGSDMDVDDKDNLSIPLPSAAKSSTPRITFPILGGQSTANNWQAKANNPSDLPRSDIRDEETASSARIVTVVSKFGDVTVRTDAVDVDLRAPGPRMGGTSKSDSSSSEDEAMPPTADNTFYSAHSNFDNTVSDHSDNEHANPAFKFKSDVRDVPPSGQPNSAAKPLDKPVTATGQTEAGSSSTRGNSDVKSKAEDKDKPVSNKADVQSSRTPETKHRKSKSRSRSRSRQRNLRQHSPPRRTATSRRSEERRGGFRNRSPAVRRRNDSRRSSSRNRSRSRDRARRDRRNSGGRRDDSARGGRSRPSPPRQRPRQRRSKRRSSSRHSSSSSSGSDSSSGRNRRKATNSAAGKASEEADKKPAGKTGRRSSSSSGSDSSSSSDSN